MTTTDRTLRVVVATALTAGMAALWAGSMYHYGDASASASTTIADAQAYPAAQIVNAVSYLMETVLFTVAAIGLAALVRGRGRTFLLVACGVLAVGLPSHVMGATFHLTLHGLATSSLPTPVQVDVLESVQGLGSIYFLLVVPFLLGLILLTAALWRARVVGWQPFAVLVADIAFGMTRQRQPHPRGLDVVDRPDRHHRGLRLARSRGHPLPGGGRAGCGAGRRGALRRGSRTPECRDGTARARPRSLPKAGGSDPSAGTQSAVAAAWGTPPRRLRSRSRKRAHV